MIRALRYRVDCVSSLRLCVAKICSYEVYHQFDFDNFFDILTEKLQNELLYYLNFFTDELANKT